MTLKEYSDRVYVYPIICHEELLYLSHLTSHKEDQVLKSIKTFHGLDDSNKEHGCMDSPEFNVVLNYIMLMFFDLASLASVSTLIVVHDASIEATFLRAIPFAVILIVDISSESMILYYHDLPLLRSDIEVPHQNKVIFNLARCMQVFVNFAWLGALLYMIWSVLNPTCVSDECTCNTNNNSTVELFCKDILINDTVDSYSNCTVTWSVNQCRKASPSQNSCILLFLVLLDGFYQMGQMFFKSYIYPLTIPEYVMFLAYWRRDEKQILQSVRRNQFGDDETLIEEMKLIPLDPSPSTDGSYVKLDDE